MNDERSFQLQPARARENVAFGWPLALTASLLLHAAWWLSCNPGSSAWNRAAAAAGGPQVSYAARLPASEMAAGPDMRSLWSPALFSLPTPMGFSAPLLAAAITSSPPLLASSNGPVWLARGEPAVGPEGLLGAAADPLLLERAPPARATEASVFTALPSPTDRIVFVTWYNKNGETRQYMLPLNGDEGAWVGDKPWEAVLRVERQPGAGPARVFLETATTSGDRNRALLRSFMNARARWPADDSASVRIRFDGVAASAAGASP